MNRKSPDEPDKSEPTGDDADKHRDVTEKGYAPPPPPPKLPPEEPEDEGEEGD